MSFKHKRDIVKAWQDTEGSVSGSGSEPSTSVDVRPDQLLQGERRAGRWHRKTTNHPVDAASLLDDDSRESHRGGGGRLRHPGPSSGYSYIKRSHHHHHHHHHQQHQEQQQEEQEQPQVSSPSGRPGRMRVVNGLKADLLLPNPLAAAPGKHDGRSNSYPPIVTIDGRVDTDLDHLIDETDDDQQYDGPVEDIPSKYPKPHIFSVIHGSLDDDVDSYANDDGTLEHTLVDAPKNFHPKDLKDVASRDTSGSRAKPGQVKGGRSGARTGGGASQLLNYTDRSHNKMHPDGSEVDRPEICSARDQQRHYQQQNTQVREDLEDKKRFPHPLSRINTGTAKPGCKRQVFSDDCIPHHGYPEQETPATALSDSFTAVHHKAMPPDVVCASQRPLKPRPSDEPRENGSQKETSQQMTENCSTNQLEAKDPIQPKPGKSMSEQTQKWADGEIIAVRRPASCTSKCSGRYGKRCLVSPRISATRAPRHDDGGNSQTGDEEEDFTFITCRETMNNKSSATLATNDSHHRSHGVRSSSNKRSGQALAPCSRKNSRHRNHKKRKGEELDSDVSSVRGFDSIESDSDDMYGPSSEDYESSEKYCSDPLASKQRFSMSDAEMSKSDTRASVEYFSRGCLRQKRRPGPSNETDYPQSRNLPLAKDAVELYGDSVDASRQRKAKSPYYGHYDVQDQAQFFDAKESASGEKPVMKNTEDSSQQQGQKYFAISKLNPEKGYRSKFLIQEMNGQGNEIAEECGGKGQEEKCREKQGEKDNQESHVDDKRWQHIERFRPIHNSRHRSYRHCPVQGNKGLHSTRRGSKSPSRQARDYEMGKVGGTRRSQDLLRERAVENRSPAKLDRRRNLSLNERQREIAVLQKRARQLAEFVKASSPNQVDGGVSLVSPKTRKNLDQIWRHKKSESMGRESCTGGQCHIRSKESRIPKRKSPQASWSIDSDHSPLNYRHAARMMPYRTRRMSKTQREAIARTEGTPVDSAYPFRELKRISGPKAAIGDFSMKPVGVITADEDLKHSLEQAMEIARQSLSAAAKVSKALNLVMTSSRLSLDSWSYAGSWVDSLSPTFGYPDSTSTKQVLRWAQDQKSPYASSQNTDLSCISLHHQISRRPLSRISKTSASPEIASSCEEPFFIGRSHVTPAHLERRRSRSVVSDRSAVLNIVPNYQLHSEKSDGNETPGPLVSIYIGGSSLNQESQQEARSLPCHAQQDNPHGASTRKGSFCVSKASLCSYKEQTFGSPTDQTNDACPIEDHKGLSELTGNSKLNVYPRNTQIVCAHVTTTQEVMISDSKLSDSSNSQEFESTRETLGCDGKTSETNKSINEEKETARGDFKQKPNADAESRLEYKDQEEIPTHEDGSVRPASQISGSKLQLPQSLGETSAKRYGKPCRVYPENLLSPPQDIKINTTFQFPGSPPSRSAMMSAALDYLKKHPNSFSPILQRSEIDSQSPKTKIFLHPEQISPPSSEYSSASEGKITPKEEKVSACGLSPCLWSPGSRVDPTGYHTDGSAVDPPRPTRRVDMNANRSPTLYSQVELGCCPETGVSPLKTFKLPLHSEARNFTNIQDNDASLAATKSRMKSDGRDSKYRNHKLSEQRPNIQIEGKARGSATLKTVSWDSKQPKNRKRKHDNRTKSQKEANVDRAINNHQQEYPQSDSNNNSSGYENLKGSKLLEAAEEEDIDFFDAVGAEVAAPRRVQQQQEEREGVVGRPEASNCNQNQPTYDVYLRLPRGGDRSEEVLRNCKPTKAEDVARDGILVSKNKDRYKRSPSSQRVRKSLCIAMQLADESLSAAAKVSQLLSQVVDVYQHRYPFHPEDIARLAVQNHAMIGEILACTKGRVGLSTASDTKALNYEGHPRKRERSLRDLDFPGDEIGLSESRRERRRRDVSDSRQRVEGPRSQSPRSYREMDLSHPQPNHGRSSERRGGLNLEERRFLEHLRDRSASPQSKRTGNLKPGFQEDLETTGKRKRSVEFCHGAKGSGECHATKSERSAEKSQCEKLKYLERRHSEELGDRDFIYGDSHHDSLKKPRENGHRQKSQSYIHRDKRDLDGSLRQLTVADVYSDCDGNQLYQGSPRNIRKHHKSLRETNSARECGRSPDRETDHCSQNKIDKSEMRVSHRASPTSFDEKGGRNKKVRDAEAQSHKDGEATERRVNHKSDKNRAESPKKGRRHQESIRSVGSSVDSPEYLKTKQRHKGRQDSCNGTTSKGKVQARSHTKTHTSKKTAPVVEDISDAMGSPNAGSGDMGSPEKESKLSSRSQSAETRSERNLKRRKRPKSSAGERKSSKSHEHRRSKSTSVDDPSLFHNSDVDAATAPVPLPAAADGKNCSYNKSLDVKNSSDNQLCVPVKHKYPTNSDAAKAQLVNWGPPESQHNHMERDQLVDFGCGQNSSTHIEDIECKNSDGCHESLNTESKPLGVNDNQDPVQNITPTSFRRVENSSSNVIHRNTSAIFSKDTYIRQEQLSANHIPAISCKTPTSKSTGGCHACSSYENPSSNTGTLTTNVCNEVDTTHPCDPTSTDPQLKETRTESGDIPTHNIHKQSTKMIEEENISLGKVAINTMDETAYERGNPKGCRNSYIAYCSLNNTTSTNANNERSFDSVLQGYKNSRARSNSIASTNSPNSSYCSNGFSSPEKTKAQSSGERPYFLSPGCDDVCCDEVTLRSNGGGYDEERPAYGGMRREKCFQFAESPTTSGGKMMRRGQQSGVNPMQLLSPEAGENISSSCECGSETHGYLYDHGLQRENVEYSSGDSMRSYTISPSLTGGGDEDYALSYSDQSSPIMLQHRGTYKKTQLKTSYPRSSSGRHHPTLPPETPDSQFQASNTAPHLQFSAQKPVSRDRSEFGSSTHETTLRDRSEQNSQNGDFEPAIQAPLRLPNQPITIKGEPVSPHTADVRVEPKGRQSIPCEANTETATMGRGLYSLYRPLDYIQLGSFSPIIEESETTAAAAPRLQEHAGSSVYAPGSRSGRRPDTSNNCNAGGLDQSAEPHGRRRTALRGASNSDINPGEDDILLLNTNNNASRNSDPRDSISVTEELTMLSDIDPDILARMPRQRRCRSQPVVPEPFCRAKRRTLPPIKPAPAIKRSGPFPFLSEYEKFRLHMDNMALCKRLVQVRKVGCSFDIGMSKDKQNTTNYKQAKKSQAMSKVMDMDRVARENETLLRRIINRESHYKRGEQLQAYDKKLPKLISFSRYPEALIKKHNLQFQ